MPGTPIPARKPILVVDDDEEALGFARAALAGAGYEIVAVTGAAEACEELRRRDFEVVVSDLRLAAGSGLDVITFAREHAPLTVGLIVTAFGSVDSAFQALREGAYDYVLKPYAPEDLLAAVRRALEHHELKVSLIEKTASLEASERRLERHLRLLENIAHEFKNPLSVVYGFSTHLLRQRPPEIRMDEVRKGLATIQRGAQRLTCLLGELLDTVRLTHRKLDLDLQAVSAWKMVEEAVAEHGLAARTRGLSLGAEGRPDAALLVLADAGRVQQVLANLIANAFKFTKPGGSVRVGAAAAEGCVRFCVRDTGVGIATQDLPRIFERFYQAEKPAGHQPGLGLGLEISRGLVELHGGRIWAESEPGRGAAFYFTLPLASPRKPKAQAG